MLAAAALALALGTPVLPPPTRVVHLAANGHTSFVVRGSMRAWSNPAPNVYRVARIASTKKSTRLWLEAAGVGRAPFFITCDGNAHAREVWLVEVR